jgi:hypothetical protein
MSLFENSRNDMPGGLRDNLVLWDAINKILKNGGIVDFAAIEQQIAQLKTQLNTLLSTILGLEHTIDGVHNYDDTSLKTQLSTLTNNLALARTDINSLQTRTGNVENEVNEITEDITGINGKPNELSLYNQSEISLSTLTANNHGTKIELTPRQLALINNGESGSGADFCYGQITLGNGDTDGGLELTSDSYIEIKPKTGQDHYLKLSPTTTELGNMRITKSAQNGITFTDLEEGSNNSVTIPWD